jgi:hypothetical protein
LVLKPSKSPLHLIALVQPLVAPAAELDLRLVESHVSRVDGAIEALALGMGELVL